MKNHLRIVGLVVVGCLIALGVYLLVTKSANITPANIGFDRSNADVLPFASKEFNQIASRSTDGILKPVSGRVFAVEVSSDSTSVRYFQLFDIRDSLIPSRTASLSALWAYKASLSYQFQPLRTVGAWQHYASKSLVFSLPIQAAATSNSPTIVRIDSSMFAPAKQFNNGILWAISTTYGAYASTSAALLNSGRFLVRIIYE